MKSCWDGENYTCTSYEECINKPLEKMLVKMLDDGYTHDAFFYAVFTAAEGVLLKDRLRRQSKIGNPEEETDEL